MASSTAPGRRTSARPGEVIDGKGNLSLVVNLHDATVTEAARRRGYDHLVAAVGDLNG